MRSASSSVRSSRSGSASAASRHGAVGPESSATSRSGRSRSASSAPASTTSSPIPLYFGEGRNVTDVFLIWKGGLGIWGAIAGGALGAYIACRRYGVSFSAVADALAPGLLVAQAIGRLGNYFNQSCSASRQMSRGRSRSHGTTVLRAISTSRRSTRPSCTLAVEPRRGGAIIAIDRKYKPTGGRAFALYAMLYTLGRGWIESLRIDTANHLGPFRLNVWTSIIVFTLALVYFVVVTRRSRRQEPEPSASDEAETSSSVQDEG
ncbi:prolipoprotein diacylglyceryl transferase family protein [Aeromicrobium sp. UC242_57]|uniref:prolipoprotein diacylglyceryl transferase family protein n=1 Tax=Aeromicrobium sp. UC242_57 TaxID=3374624 RepID=UPI0037A4B095